VSHLRQVDMTRGMLGHSELLNCKPLKKILSSFAVTATHSLKFDFAFLAVKCILRDLAAWKFARC